MGKIGINDYNNASRTLEILISDIEYCLFMITASNIDPQESYTVLDSKELLNYINELKSLRKYVTIIKSSNNLRMRYYKKYKKMKGGETLYESIQKADGGT